MTDYNPPTQRAHDDRVKFDALRHQIAQFDYTGHHVPVGPTPSRLPCTNQPLFSLFDDESIITRSPQYTLRHHGPTAESLINCHDREDITELKPLSDVGLYRGEGSQDFHKVLKYTAMSRDILPHSVVCAHRFRADIYRSNRDGTEHVCDIIVHVERLVHEHVCNKKPPSQPNQQASHSHKLTPAKRTIDPSDITVSSDEGDTFVFTDVNILATMDDIIKSFKMFALGKYKSFYGLPDTKMYQLYLFTSHKGIALCGDDSVVGCHLRDGDQLHMRIVPALPRLYDDRCVNCLIKEFQVAEGGPNTVKNGQSYWLGNHHPHDILNSPRPTNAIDEHSLYYDETEDE
eukprot:scaffold73632_cov22-Cyclotella_meneghiniana.AAC.3